ncbi:hypothetical protein [uncultured Sutterella sp.]|uniref:hypothetical protein n=1 Tax=uncultured Sutterella sp. TaxID=286133 RepID=UPI00266FE284|nr:hypothetical protein [uncultured Sutterella sp.]
MYVSQEGGSTKELPGGTKTGVISCRLPFELKLAIEGLAKSQNVVLSHVIREIIQEAVAQGDCFWWKAGAANDEIHSARKPGSLKLRLSAMRPAAPPL